MLILVHKGVKCLFINLFRCPFRYWRSQHNEIHGGNGRWTRYFSFSSFRPWGYMKKLCWIFSFSNSLLNSKKYWIAGGPFTELCSGLELERTVEGLSPGHWYRLRIACASEGGISDVSLNDFLCLSMVTVYSNAGEASFYLSRICTYRIYFTSHNPC